MKLGRPAHRAGDAVVVALHTVAGADDAHLAASYNFDNVIDNITADASANGNNARVSGAMPISGGSFAALQFDGEDDFVDCGNSDTLNPNQQITVECWVHPDMIPTSEVGIVGKGVAAWSLTYYTDGQVWWYINTGGNNTHAGVPLESWSYVVGTYDGNTMRLYVNGQLAGERPLTEPINAGPNLLIGNRPDQAGFFRGAIGQVRIHDRAIDAESIRQRYDEASRQYARVMEPIDAGPTLRGDGWQARSGAGGAMQIDIGPDRYLIESRFSYPGDMIGYHTLAANGNGFTTTTGDNHIALSRAFEHSTLERVARIDGRRIVVTDTLTNTTDADVAVLYRNELIVPDNFDDVRLSGAPQSASRMTAENPSLFVAQPHSRLGFLAEDAVYRLQLQMAAQRNNVKLDARNFALKAGQSHTFQWAIYPFDATADYWTFANQVRRDWDVNFPLIGSFDYFSVTSHPDLIADPDRLRAYLERKKVKVIAAMPWLDYDNHNYQTGRPTDRGEYMQLMRQFRDTVHAIDPDIRVIGCIEGNLVSLPQSLAEAVYQLAPNKAQNQYIFTEEQLAALREHDLRWNDCLLMNSAGKYRYELYYRGNEGAKIPYVAIAVYAAPGNGQHLYWMDQAKYIMEDVGLDGIYIDQFNMAFADAQRYSYEQWDGTTVDIDRTTGRITRRYTDAALVGQGARRDLVQYVLGRGGYMLANTFPATAATQSLRMHRFNESEWYFSPHQMHADQQPPLSHAPSKGHFSTPIALGFRPRGTPDQYTYSIMKGAITYLRHGLLYYHYGTELPAPGATGGGEYGAINHMFPITPVELHAGLVVGEERTVTCISGAHRFLGANEPHLRVFDLNGMPVEPNASIARDGEVWRVDLNLRDWAEIAIIE